jgi:hypothetical protein
MTKEKLQELRERMMRHGVGNHPVSGAPLTAIVVLTAAELQELLDIAEKHQPK